MARFGIFEKLANCKANNKTTDSKTDKTFWTLVDLYLYDVCMETYLPISAFKEFIKITTTS